MVLVFKIVKRLDIDPDDLEADEILDKLLAEAQEVGGFLHVRLCVKDNPKGE